MSKYVVIVERPDPGENWSAYAPDLNVYATAESRDDVLDQIRDAIAFHFDGLREDGRAIPAPTSSAVEVEIAA